MESENVYSLEELIEKLDMIRNNGEGQINLAKAAYSLCIEIMKLKQVT